MTLHTLRWANPLNKLNGVQFYTTCFIFMENLLTELPGELNLGHFCFVFWKKKKKRLYLLLLGGIAGPQRPGVLPFEANSSPVTQYYQTFLQVVVCNCVTVRDQEYFSPLPRLMVSGFSSLKRVSNWLWLMDTMEKLLIEQHSKTPFCKESQRR